MRTIREGDVVNIVWIKEEITPNVFVEHTPGDIGDLWYFDDHGKKIAVNPMSYEFVLLEKL